MRLPSATKGSSHLALTLALATALDLLARAEADLLRQSAPLFSVIRRYHGIVARKPPALAVFLRRQAVAGHDVALEHLELPAVLETNKVVGGDRAAGGYRWRGLATRTLCSTDADKCLVNFLY